MRIENREALNQLEEYAKQVIGVGKCRILICAGTGCLAGGSGEIYKKMCELVKGYPDVSVEFGPEIAHGNGPVAVKRAAAMVLRDGTFDADRADGYFVYQGVGG